MPGIHSALGLLVAIVTHSRQGLPRSDAMDAQMILHVHILRGFSSSNAPRFFSIYANRKVNIHAMDCLKGSLHDNGRAGIVLRMCRHTYVGHLKGSVY